MTETQHTPPSIPPISKERVIELLDTLRPVMQRGCELWYIAAVAPWSIAFTWCPIPTVEANDLEVVRTIPTLHTFAAPVFFKPTIAEVMAQLPEDLDGVVAFSTQGPADADEMDDDAYRAGFHLATTTLYRRKAKVPPWLETADTTRSATAP